MDNNQTNIERADQIAGYLSNDGNDTINGGEGNDTIYTGTGNDTIKGGVGNDFINGDTGSDTYLFNLGDGNDTIVDTSAYGSLDRDTLILGAGNNTLIGGIGSDNLNGGAGSDTYVFKIGDGIDTITDWSQYGSSDSDTITFGEGITKEDICFIMNNGNLLIGYSQNDTINVQYAQNTQAQIEQFTLSDGNYLTSNDINVIIQSMNAYATDYGMSITSLDAVKSNQDLMNIVASGWHNNTVI